VNLSRAKPFKSQVCMVRPDIECFPNFSIYFFIGHLSVCGVVANFIAYGFYFPTTPFRQFNNYSDKNKVMWIFCLPWTTNLFSLCLEFILFPLPITSLTPQRGLCIHPIVSLSKFPVYSILIWLLNIFFCTFSVDTWLRPTNFWNSFTYFLIPSLDIMWALLPLWIPSESM